ncbi:hypothetical protein L1887_39079 [Cichorium endivia]|nr:hypothetical protein L1887_39073 [Cichorium endivia]KAI3496706.1 hypothetical protein L1887_39079 [Cichorium endivia]
MWTHVLLGISGEEITDYVEEGVERGRGWGVGIAIAISAPVDLDYKDQRSKTCKRKSGCQNKSKATGTRGRGWGVGIAI